MVKSLQIAKVMPFQIISKAAYAQTSRTLRKAAKMFSKEGIEIGRKCSGSEELLFRKKE